MIDEELKNAVMTDIILLSLVGIHVVLIHGGGPEINDMLKKIGKEPKFVNGLRYTDEETMEIVQMVLAGKVNKSLTQLIESQGGRAIGPVSYTHLVNRAGKGYINILTKSADKSSTVCQNA